MTESEISQGEMTIQSAGREITSGAKSIFENIFSSKAVIAVLYVVILLIGLKVVDLAVKTIRKRAVNKNSPMIGFLAGIVKAILVVTVILQICSLFHILDGLASQILMSSSLLIAVAGFVFQEGLSNIVHGFILSTSHPFQIGDRVRFTVDGQEILGYVKALDLRSTVIQDIFSGTTMIVPNAKLDTVVIDNSRYEKNAAYSGFLCFQITYESDLERAMELAAKMVEEYPLCAAERKRQHISAPVSVVVTELADSGISLKATVTTRSAEENYTALCDLRKELVLRFNGEANVELAYPHVQIIQ